MSKLISDNFEKLNLIAKAPAKKAEKLTLAAPRNVIKAIIEISLNAQAGFIPVKTTRSEKNVLSKLVAKAISLLKKRKAIAKSIRLIQKLIRAAISYLA